MNDGADPTVHAADHSESLTFARIAEHIASQPHVELTLQQVVDLARDTVSGCDFVGISLREGQGRVTTPVATDDIAEQADNLQYELGEGPCLQAVWSDDECLIPDIAHDARWPEWAAGAAALGIGSVLSTRLATGTQVLGALNLYSRQANAFDGDATITAHIYATHASIALALRTEVAGLETALQTRHSIGLVQGLLMQRYGLQEDAAFQVLRRLSSQRNMKLRDVASELLNDFRSQGKLI